MVTWIVYLWIINFNVGKRHAHEVVKCNVDQWSIGSAEGSDVNTSGKCEISDHETKNFAHHNFFKGIHDQN